MRLAWVALLLLWIPSASACTVLYTPFEQPTHDDVLRYVDGTRLVEVEGQRERTVLEAYALSYAPTEGGLVVAGQDGLGPDCSGDTWLAYREGGEERWRRDGAATVWPHPAGPIVAFQQEYHRLEGGGLTPLDVDVPEAAHVLAWTSGSEPIYRLDTDASVHVGDVRLAVQGDEWPEAAAGPEGAAVLTANEREAALHIVSPGGADAGADYRILRWSVEGDFERPAIAWAGSWYVAVAGNAYRITDDVVIDLGLNAKSIGARDGQALVFSDGRYEVVDGNRSVQAWRLAENVWIPDTPTGDPQPVEATLTSAPTSPATTTPSPTGAGGGTSVPGPTPVLLAIALAVAGGIRARRVGAAGRDHP